MKVLILGSGGREHAIAWSISKSSFVDRIFIAPGNAGTAEIGINVPIDPTDFEEIKTFLIEMLIDMVIVGPEQPLVDGIYDFIRSDSVLDNVKVIGPSKEASQLEGSKLFAKEFMQRHNIPTAKYREFDKVSIRGAKEFIDELKPPYVLKADGLAAGKGVLILDDAEEAKIEIDNILKKEKFGEAGETLLIEEFLDGIEMSAFVLTDGKEYVILPEAKDYKRIGEGDTGLNTGGMGCISPVPFADKKFMDKVEEKIIKPTVNGISREGMKYNGFIFFGLMNVKGEPYVIEYNVRLGDPEAEVVLPRLKSDLMEIFIRVSENTLGSFNIRKDSRSVSTVMLVSGGYPEEYEKGKIINIDAVDDNTIIFHAGTTKDQEGKIITNGGRVIAVSAYGKNLQIALAKSYKSIKKIDFEKKNYRKDIGKDLLSKI